MAYSEQKASLPPIIEDESDDNLMPMLYRKELGRSDSKAEDRMSAPTGVNSNTSSSSTSGAQMPYNSWKSKNAAYLRSPEMGRDSSDMLSRLGQTLETCPTIVSPQLKQTQFGSHQNYQQSMESPGYRQADSQYRTEGGGLSHMDERGRYLLQNQENHDPKGFSSPSTTNARGYFSNQNGTYPEHIYSSQNHLRMIDPGYSNHDSSKFQQGSERSFNHSNVTSSPFGHTNGSGGNYKLQNLTPNRFQTQMFHSEFPGPLGCQNSCCRSSQPVQRMGEMHSYRNDKNHSPLESPNYHQEFSRRQALNSSHKTVSCDCHQSMNIKNRKKESKQEKDRLRQITDLYRIVFLQNQQIMELQNQVKKLIELHEKYDERSKRSDQDHAAKILSKGEKRMFNLSVIEENQNLMEKVSVGIMTSFIDSTTMKSKNKSKTKSHGISHRPSKSSDSSSSSSSESYSQTSSDEEVEEYTKKSKHKKRKSPKTHEDSILLNGLEIATVAENPPSPSPPPMHLELQEFAGSSSNSEDSDSSDDNAGNPIPVSWTFYDKVVGKVNNMLNKSESDDDSNEIRKKTLEQLRKLGINFVDQESSPSSKRVTFDSPYHQRPVAESDTSMRMNALAMKYLKEERLSQETAEKPDSGRKLKKKKEKRTEEKNIKKKKSKSGQVSGKILDITAIKQQPKLLPKKM